MVKGEKFQAAILSLLQSRSTIVNLLNSNQEIEERNWMGRDFLYPAVRVQILRMNPPPTENGECRPLITDALFTVICYTDTNSSKDCLHLMDAVSAGMRGVRLHTTADIIPMSRIDILDYIWPVAEGDRIWRGEVQSRVRVKEPGALPQIVTY